MDVVVAVLDMVQKGETSKRQPARELGMSRPTVDRALERSHLYGLIGVGGEQNANGKAGSQSSPLLSRSPHRHIRTDSQTPAGCHIRWDKSVTFWDRSRNGNGDGQFGNCSPTYWNADCPGVGAFTSDRASRRGFTALRDSPADFADPVRGSRVRLSPRP